VRIASDYAHLTSGRALERPIEIDELGSVQTGSVWSATSASGEHDGAACYEWTTAYAEGGQGAITATAERWTWISSSDPSEAMTVDCASDGRLYCFEK
jgi:hypothetical protein